MQRLWFISNQKSGSTSADKCEAIEAICRERGLELAGRTSFPDDPLPDDGVLAGAGADTILLFAGDGTINAALCALADWDGAALILPGGTMNLLARRLHGDAEPAAIIHAAHGAPHRIALPFAEAGGHRAFVGMIAGPSAHWAEAREAARDGQLPRLLDRARNAWRNTFGDKVRLTGVPGLRDAYQAVFVAPHDEGLDVAAIDARDWRQIVELGWDWLRGDWLAARAVSYRRVGSLGLAGPKPMLALFDGEPQPLASGTAIARGMTKPMFLATVEKTK